MKIIQFFLDNSLQEFSQTEIIRKTRIAKGTAVTNLRLLVKDKIVHLKRIGVTNLYSLNRESNIVKELKKINTLLKFDKINNLKENIEVYLFGSAARGENTENSDIDLLIIGKTEKRKIHNFFERYSKKLGKPIKIQLFTAIDWSRMQRSDKAFFERVEKDKIKLL